MFLRWMMFVDGENLSIRATAFAQKLNPPCQLATGVLYERDSFVWFEGKTPLYCQGASIPTAHYSPMAVRAYYYTTVQGDLLKKQDVEQRINKLGFTPVVFTKPSKSRSKGVDIAITRDALCHAFRNNYDAAVIVAGDKDYCVLVDELKRLGKRVIVLFFDGRNGCVGVSKELRLEADHFVPLENEHAGLMPLVRV